MIFANESGAEAGGMTILGLGSPMDSTGVSTPDVAIVIFP